MHKYYAQPIYYAGVSKCCESLTDWSIPLKTRQISRILRVFMRKSQAAPKKRSPEIFESASFWAFSTFVFSKDMFLYSTVSSPHDWSDFTLNSLSDQTPNTISTSLRSIQPLCNECSKIIRTQISTTIYS